MRAVSSRTAGPSLPSDPPSRPRRAIAGAYLSAPGEELSSFQISLDSSEARVHDLLHAKQFLVKEAFEARKAHVHVRPEIAEPRVVDEDADQHGERRHGNAEDHLQVLHLLSITRMSSWDWSKHRVIPPANSPLPIAAHQLYTVAAPEPAGALLRLLSGAWRFAWNRTVECQSHPLSDH